MPAAIRANSLTNFALRPPRGNPETRGRVKGLQGTGISGMAIQWLMSTSFRPDSPALDRHSRTESQCPARSFAINIDPRQEQV
jgi:hypothetical protein